MRQAGRYLAEYRATRARAGSFMGLATNPAFATEVTLQPLERYALDAAILFSDILTVPDAMGLGLSFEPGEGPRFERPLRDEAAIARAAVPDLAKLRYVFDAVASIRRALDGRVPLIGFAGSPWTLACYMVEGAGSDDYRHVKTLMYARPDLLHRILAINADAVAAYLNAQIDAGAQAVMVFDSLGRRARARLFRSPSVSTTRGACCAQLTRERDGRAVPRIVFTKGGGPWLEAIAACGADVVGLDWTVPLRAGACAHRRPRGVAGQPRPGGAVRAARGGGGAGARGARRFRRAAASDGRLGGHVFNLGHGISQHTPPDACARTGRGGARPLRAEL